jgi:diguanylate cyclase (GGDEF)-like protein/PAS domain S-box-containing protein
MTGEGKNAVVDYRELSILQQTLIDSANYGIISTDIDGTIRSFNNAASKMLGYRSEEVIGKHTPRLFHDPAEIMARASSLSLEIGRTIKPGFDVFVEKAKQGLVEELEWSYIHKDGHRLLVILSITALKDELGNINGFLGVSHDISETQRIKQALKEEEQRYRLLFEKAIDSIFLVKDGFFIACNPATLDLFGCSHEQIINQTPFRFSPEFQPDGQLSRIKAREKITLTLQGVSQFFEWQHIRFDGSSFDAEVTLNAIEIKGEYHVYGTVRDISARKEVERQLEKSTLQLVTQNESLRLINSLSSQLHGSRSIQSIADKTLSMLLRVTKTPYIGIYLIDEEKQTLNLMASNGFTFDLVKIIQLADLKNTITGLSFEKSEIIVSEDITNDDHINKKFRQELLQINISSNVSIPLVYEGKIFGLINLCYHKKHEFKFIEKETLQLVANTVSQSLASAYQIKNLDYMAHHDSLTGLSNRLDFHTLFKQKASHPDYQSAALLLLDLDRFKEINDTLGHHVGDLLLKEIGPRLKQTLAGHKTLVSRLGGDEFIILIDNISDQKTILRFANLILKRLRKPFAVDSMMLEIDASLGIAKYPEDGGNSHALLRSADVAMYEAKNRGGGLKIYDINDDKHTPQRLALIAELNGAIREEQLELHYQPKINLASGKISGFEALVRWRHRSMGLLYPDKFIPLAEMSDSIHYLTEAVLRIALQQQKQWFKAGIHLPVSVNLSVRNLIDERCVHFIETMLREFDIQAGMLELEITETALMQDPELAVKLLKRLSVLGVKLSIDDYGTGYSSLSYLRRLPINILKIDREFVKDMLANEQDSIIISSTIGLAHNLQLEVVAEGVEDAETMARLKTLGCDHAQGYYICKPKLWSEIAHWMQLSEPNSVG